MLTFLHRGNKEAREAIQGMANFSNYAIKWFRFIIFQKQSCLLQAVLLLAHEQVWEKNDFFNNLLILKTIFGILAFGFLFLLNYLWPDFDVSLFRVQYHLAFL